MKIEMGESLFYSWLRHVKECQIVQMNWGVSPGWELNQEELLSSFMHETAVFFSQKYEYDIYKQNSFSQLMRQAELDVLGVSFDGNSAKVFAVDVAFHENGLNYGSRKETVERIIKKSLRTAMSLVGYLNIAEGEIIFASPKIHNAVLDDLDPCVADMNEMLAKYGFDYQVRIIANQQFSELVLDPILIASSNISDTSELFLRSYQLLDLFSTPKARRNDARTLRQHGARETLSINNVQMKDDGALSELKVGRIANKVLRSILESNLLSEDEVERLQQPGYSKEHFHINYPLLIVKESNAKVPRYYSNSLSINGKQYYMCSEWYETKANNDRPYLLKWISEHSGEVKS